MKRKTFILAALFMVAAQVFAQYETNAPIDQKTGLVTYSRIVSVDGASAADLFSRAQSWFATYYTSAKDVLQQQDADRAMLVGRSFFELVNNGGYMYYTVTVRCKDGRAKIDISHLQHEQLARFAGQMPDFGNMENWVAGTTGLPKYITKNLPKVADLVNADAQALLNNFEQSMQVADTSDDW